LLKEKTIVIPGIFFDINPAHRRNLFNSPCHHFVRISFGPPLEDLERGANFYFIFSSPLSNPPILPNTNIFVTGLDAIGRVLRRARKEGMRGFGHDYKDGDSESAADTI
jgi:hypothetical protein